MSSGTQEGEPPGGAGQLQRRLDRYRSLFDQAPVAYLITDRSGLRDHLRRLDGRGPHTWELRIRPRRGRPRPVAVAVEALGDGQDGVDGELRWVLQELEPSTARRRAGPRRPTGTACPRPCTRSSRPPSRCSGPTGWG